MFPQRPADNWLTSHSHKQHWQSGSGATQVVNHIQTKIPQPYKKPQGWILTCAPQAQLKICTNQKDGISGVAAISEEQNPQQIILTIFLHQQNIFV